MSNVDNVSVDDVVVSSVQSFLTSRGVMSKGRTGTQWQGTMTELLSELSRSAGRTQASNLPGSASSLRVVLDRVVNRIRCRGVTVKFTRTTDHNRTRLVRFVG